jgi:V-type H+-transporting ATPase subunit D
VRAACHALRLALAQCKETMGVSFKDGMFALAEVKYAAGDIKPMVIENASVSTTKVALQVDNVAGVKVPVFTAGNSGHDVSTELIGMAKGGQQIVKAREAFSKAVDVLVKLATLQTSFITLDEAVKVTNRRVNALDCVVVPRLTATVAYINSELDELEREEFFRCARHQAPRAPSAARRRCHACARRSRGARAALARSRRTPLHPG